MAPAATPPTAAGRARARTLLFFSGVLFGLSALLARIATRGPDGMTGGQTTFARFVVGLLAVTAIFVVRPGTLRPTNYKLLAVRGLFGGLAALLYFQAIALIPAGEATLLNNTFPIFAVILSFFILRERPTIHLAIALVIASIGVYLVLGGGQVSFSLGTGELLAIGSAVFGGAAVTAIRALRATHNAPTIFLAFTLGSLLVSSPAALQPWPAGPLPWVAAGAVGLVAFLAQLLMTEAYGALSVAEAALWQQLTPIASFAWALSIGETLTGWTTVGVLLGIAGVIYGSAFGHRPRPDAPPELREAAAGITSEEP